MDGAWQAGSNFDLVLNAVAAGFVLDLDEAVYGFFVANYIKSYFGGLPPLAIAGKEADAAPARYVGLALLSFVVKVALVCSLHVGSMMYWCVASGVTALPALSNGTNTSMSP